ncbi:hypothetical protein BDZ91DRAFT_780550 [Kalaharituber pfeilii]|nr:hypothetical protein BDZ91DRAFT_780550 [Kalaharituber pfeilii]
MASTGTVANLVSVVTRLSQTHPGTVGCCGVSWHFKCHDHFSLSQYQYPPMPWPPKYTRLFQLAAREGEIHGAKFYGPYNALLNYLFPVEEGFMVVPQYKRSEQAKQVDFTTIFLVSHREHPVLFLEIKVSGHIRHLATRRDADKQMREWAIKVFDDVEAGVLYGLSAIGTRLCVYKVHKHSGYIEPKAIVDDPNTIKDTAPKDRWNFDLLTPEGEERLWQIPAVKVSCSGSRCAKRSRVPSSFLSYPHPTSDPRPIATTKPIPLDSNLQHQNQANTNTIAKQQKRKRDNRKRENNQANSTESKALTRAHPVPLFEKAISVATK